MSARPRRSVLSSSMKRAFDSLSIVETEKSFASVSKLYLLLISSASLHTSLGYLGNHTVERCSSSLETPRAHRAYSSIEGKEAYLYIELSTALSARSGQRGLWSLQRPPPSCYATVGCTGWVSFCLGTYAVSNNSTSISVIVPAVAFERRVIRKPAVFLFSSLAFNISAAFPCTNFVA